MSVMSQAQTTGLREHCAYLSHTGLEWRQPPTPSHSSRFFFPLCIMFVLAAADCGSFKGLVFLMSLWVVVKEAGLNAL